MAKSVKKVSSRKARRDQGFWEKLLADLGLPAELPEDPIRAAIQAFNRALPRHEVSRPPACIGCALSGKCRGPESCQSALQPYSSATD
jgi:hypothetical protein